MICSRITRDPVMNMEVSNEEKAREAFHKFFNNGKPPRGPVVDTRIIELLNMVHPSYQFEGKSFAQKCFELFEEEKPKIKQILQSVEGDISLSLDILTSGKTKNQYLCLSAHFIDDNWKLKRFVLCFNQLNDLNLLHEIVLNSLKDWDIEHKISTITTAKGTPYNEALEFIKNRIHKIKQLHLDGILFRVYCCADFVKELVVQHLYGSIASLMIEINDVYPLNKAIPTWNDRCSDLRIARMSHGSGHFRAHYKYGGVKIKHKKWGKVLNICNHVDDIYEFVFELFELGFPTANIFLYNLGELHFYLNRKLTEPNCLKCLAEKMLPSSARYMKDMYMLLAITSVMDPRLKMKYIEFSSSKFNKSDEYFQVGPVLVALYSLFGEYIAKLNVPIKQKCEVASEDTPELMREYNEFVQSSTRAMASELECYLEEPVLPWIKTFDVLTWWKVSSFKYPMLSMMARDLLAIPVCVAVGDEGLWMEQRAVDPCVVSYLPHFTNAFVCIRSWFFTE